MPRRRYHGGLASVSRPGSDPGSEPPADAVAMDHGCPRIQGAVRFRNLSGRHATTSELSTDSPATHAPATSGWTRCSGLARLAVPVFSPTAVESGRSHAAIPDRTRTSSSDLRPRMSLQLSKPLAVPAVPVRIPTSVLRRGSLPRSRAASRRHEVRVPALIRYPVAVTLRARLHSLQCTLHSPLCR